MGFLKKLLKFEKKNLKKMTNMVKDNPERLLLGAADPLSSKVWGKALGKDYEPIVNQWGGPTKQSFQEAAEAGIDVGPASKLHGAAQTVASIYAGGYGGSQLGNLAGGGLKGGALKYATPTLMNAGAEALEGPAIPRLSAGFDSGPGQHIRSSGGLGRQYDFNMSNPYSYGMGPEKSFMSRGYSDGGAVEDGYESADEAARAALRGAVPLSGEHEYAGVIYERDGRFFFTKPKSSGKTHDVNVRVTYPKGAKLSALYHTHPDGEDSELFSPQDIDAATQLKVPYYMGHVRDGTMSAFKPGESKVKSARRSKESAWRGARPSYSPGEPLGKLFEELAEAQSMDTEDQVAMGYSRGGSADAQNLAETIGEIASVPGGIELLMTEASKQQGQDPKKLRLYSMGGSVEYAGGGLVEAAEMVRGGGRGDDEVLLHLSPEEYEVLTSMWGEPEINPVTGLPEYGFLSKAWKKVKGAVKKVVKSPLFSFVAPLALNVFAPGLGSAIGGALGLSGKAASLAGNTLIRGGAGALSGGKEGALAGAVSGLTQGGLGADIGGKLGMEGMTAKLAGDALIGGGASSLGGGDFMTGALGQAQHSLIQPKLESAVEGGIRSIFKPGSAIDSGKITPDTEGFRIPSVDEVPLGDTAGVLGLPGGIPPAGAAADPSMLGKVGGWMKEHPWLTAGAGALLLGSMGGGGRKEPGAPQLPPEFTQGLPEYDFNRNRSSGVPDYYTYGQAGSPNEGEFSFFNQNNIGQLPGSQPPIVQNPGDPMGWPGNMSAQELQKLMLPRAFMADGGHTRGPGSGRSDDIEAMLSDGEYVMDAETVSLLGDGSNDEGARRLDEMREELRRHKGQTLAKGKFSPDARLPIEYLGER